MVGNPLIARERRRVCQQRLTAARRSQRTIASRKRPVRATRGGMTRWLLEDCRFCHDRGRHDACSATLRPMSFRSETLGRWRRQIRPGSEEHTSEILSLMRISYAVFCLKKKKNIKNTKPYIYKQ